jgi:uncharacterized membrane protein
MSEKSARKLKPAKPAKVAREKAVKANRDDLPNPVWFKPIMFGFFLLGLFWMVTYYITQGAWPLGSAVPNFNLKDYNILIGFGLVMVGFAMTTRWR